VQLNGSSIIQAGQQLSSPIQIQLRHESLEDRHKTVAASSNDVKPLLPSVGQSSAIHSADASSIQKVTPPFALSPCGVIFYPLPGIAHFIAKVAATDCCQCSSIAVFFPWFCPSFSISYICQ